MNWLPREVRVLRDMAASGATLSATAKRLKRGRSAVATKADSLGVEFHGRTTSNLSILSRVRRKHAALMLDTRTPRQRFMASPRLRWGIKGKDDV